MRRFVSRVAPLALLAALAFAAAPLAAHHHDEGEAPDASGEVTTDSE